MAIAPPVLENIPAQRKTSLDIFAPLRFWHLASLDAPTVAVVWTLAFAHAAQVQLPLWIPIVLALSAWSAYIGDRLLDARKPDAPLRPRHRFHWQYRRVFLPLAVAAAVAAISLTVFSMPVAARERNTILAAAALAYFGGVHSPWRPSFLKLKLPKELLVGVIFTLACATPAWARMSSHSLIILMPVLIFTALAWLNCQAIETWESAGNTPVFHLSIALAAISLLTAIFAAKFGQPRLAALLTCACLSAAMLALLDRQQLRLSSTTLRAAADLVLLTPLALLALP